MADPAALLTEAAGPHAGSWDVAGALPRELLRRLGGEGVLCAAVPAEFGGLGLSGLADGRLTAHAGSLCGSLRSVMTSQGMAAWTIRRFGDREQRAGLLARLTGGDLAAVCFSEAEAGSDLSAVATRITDSADTDGIVVSGEKVWVTAAAYADLLLVAGTYGSGAAIAAVPATATGVTVEKIPDPLGCRAAGHSNVRLDSVRLPRSALLAGSRLPMTVLVTMALTHGRLSVAWGCVGMLRACLAAAVRHVGARHQFGTPLAGHQLVARHVADLHVAERTATLACERASDSWDRNSPDLVTDAVLAKYVASGNAAAGAARAVQVLASAAAQDGHVVARAYRDAKLMELIEGTSEICQLVLARRAIEEHS
ncbi:acyl-CoA/acyl-ACP dehydrogenase [Amycolatopsis sp. OK19-0408]|uniref:Acyl-CoA/acyl-ACP dehydrogenase n=1 Tax=Amycolatopsis iheyensis TaxID=2945988 RepID=A0A9X2NGL8_9PSEU|nr:acyl-CoA dehydrogenase family protein [Amycolatopsis iheyensis]MCR6488431.1 acyl-CoA/acyl-ACP dehydrogenase [Amycolatopsis iheyensis]